MPTSLLMRSIFFLQSRTRKLNDKLYIILALCSPSSASLRYRYFVRGLMNEIIAPANGLANPLAALLHLFQAFDEHASAEVF